MENHADHEKHDDKKSIQVEEKVLNTIEGAVTSVFWFQVWIARMRSPRFSLRSTIQKLQKSSPT
jgi:hypothetical protein